MYSDYLADIEKTLSVLSAALDSVHASENSGVQIHPNVGNSLTTAKAMIAETLQLAISDREKARQAETEVVQDAHPIHSFKDSCEMLFSQLSNMLDYKIKYGDELWEDISVGLPLDEEFYPGYGVILRCMEDDCRETFFSLSVYENFTDKNLAHELLSVCTEKDDFLELKEAFDALMTQLPLKLAASMYLPAQENSSVDPSSLGTQRNTQINYLYQDANHYKAHNECIISGVLTKEQQATILSCLDQGVYFIPHLVSMPEVKFDEVDDSSANHQWFQLYEDSFEITTKKPTISATAVELTNDFCKCKGLWNELYLAESSSVKSWNTRYGVVGIDNKRSAYTVREYNSADAYLKDFSRITSAFEHRIDALREGQRICRLLNVPFVHPDKKNSLDNLIDSASSRISDSCSVAVSAPER